MNARFEGAVKRMIMTGGSHPPVIDTKENGSLYVWVTCGVGVSARESEQRLAAAETDGWGPLGSERGKRGLAD